MPLVLLLQLLDALPETPGGLVALCLPQLDRHQLVLQRLEQVLRLAVQRRGLRLRLVQLRDVQACLLELLLYAELLLPECRQLPLDDVVVLGLLGPYHLALDEPVRQGRALLLKVFYPLS
uniref:Putative secreted protein n=1 Tax=Ixodes ricinus TaxID=34613 RepID=A0A6B0UMG0_IXORI